MKNVILTLRLYGSNRVPAIKAMRDATGLGLKESKDIIDASWHSSTGGVRVRMTAEQYGLLRVLADEVATDESTLSFSYVRLEANDVQFDTTKA